MLPTAVATSGSPAAMPSISESERPASLQHRTATFARASTAGTSTR
jgi:hypothetical protein